MCTACIGTYNESAGIDPCRCGSPRTHAAMRRIEEDIRRRELIGGGAAILGMFAGFGLAPAKLRAQTPSRQTLLTNLRLFDGETLTIREGLEVLVADGRIAGLPARGQGPSDATVINCGGRTVMPGLIDCHWHATLAAVSETVALMGDIGFVHLMAGREAGATLMRGFTTVRDTGGPAFGLKLAIDRGVIPGPRIFPSGAMISQTSGHGDFRFLNEVPRMPSTPAHYSETQGMAAIADGVDQVLRRTRE